MTINDTVTTGHVRDCMLSRNGIIVSSRAFVGLLLGLFLFINAGWAACKTVQPEALEALYSLDFDVAERKFQQLTEEDPTNPRYWNLLASSIWLRIIHEQEKMNLASYAGSRLGTHESDDAVNSKTEARLRRTLFRAIELGEAILADYPEDIETLYALGVSHGTLASFEATVKRAYLKANRGAKKAREYHMQVLAIDPTYNDARFSIGTYDYALGAIPGFVRFLLGFIGIWGGDKEGGIEQLEYAAQFGRQSSTNAKMVLVVIYNREKEYDKALAVLKDLHSRYPRNFLLELAKGSIHQRKKEWGPASEVYRSVLSKVETDQDDYGRLEVDSVLFKIGELNVHGFDTDGLSLEGAVDAFEKIVMSNQAGDDLKGRSHLWMGKIFDSQNERDKALEHYSSVLVLDCSDVLKREASGYRRQPFKG